MQRRQVFPILMAAFLSSFVATASAGERNGCEGADAAKSPTPADKGPQSGSNNAGSTGWHNGVGGNHTDATPSGPLPGSEQYQPPVARGLDLKMPDPPEKC